MVFAFALPEWLMSEHYITLATWGLVIATIILYLDSRAKGKDQKERWEREDSAKAKEQLLRWEREDRLRAEDAKPKVAVEIAKRDESPEIVFKCFNLGGTVFFIDQLVVTTSATVGHSVSTMDLVGPPVLLPGTVISTNFDCTYLLRAC